MHISYDIRRPINDWEPIILNYIIFYISNIAKSFSFSISKRALCFESYRFEILLFYFCEVESLELYDYSLWLLVFYPSFWWSKLLCKYWHLSPYLQKPLSKKLWQSFVLYFKLRRVLSLISSSLWAKAHWNKVKCYKFIKGTESSFVPKPASLCDWKRILRFCTWLWNRWFFGMREGR